METTWVLRAIYLATMLSLGICTGERVYRVTSIVSEPYLMLRNDSKARGNDLYEGFIVDLLSAVADVADFRYEIHLVPDNKYGMLKSDGSWDGMIGQVLRGDADIAAAPLTQTKHRWGVVDFAYAFQPVTLAALLRSDIDIGSIDELVNQTNVNYGTLEHGSTQQAFIGATKPLYRSMWSHMASQKHTVFARTFKEGVKRARNEDFALIVERPMGEYVVGRPPCDLKLIGKFMTGSLPRSYSFALSKQHPLLKKINAAMFHLQEDMSIAKLSRKWWPDLCYSAANTMTTSAVTISMTLLLGLFLSVAVL